ncbi:hypothetical protein AHAS_Ahas03G0231000 [Arachis hypogaea]
MLGMVGYGDFGWLDGCCCDIGMRIGGCCGSERRSCSIFDFDCSLVHSPFTLDWNYYYESNCFDLEIDRVDGCCSLHWLPQGHSPLVFDGIGQCNMYC